MSKVILDVPYHNQLNNKYNPYGSCNVTSAAMVVKYVYRKAGKDNGWLKKFPTFREEQLEDEMYRVMQHLGLSRHNPWDIQNLIKLYGVSDKFEEFSTLKAVKKDLDKGYPLICHGWFTTFGHIIVIIGYDDKEKVFYVHDPYGEYWENGYENGYDTTVSGANLKYSYDLIKRVCIASDKSFWIHHIGNLLK